MNGRPIEVTASHTYLGIGINNKLKWAEHISNTVSKANKVLGLLRQNLHSCSPFVKETAYRQIRQIRSLDSYVKISIVVLLLLKKPLIGHWLDQS